MDESNLTGAMDSENIETEVIQSNSVLTLITTEDGIPTSTEVTVLTTALGDVSVPLMTLTDVPLSTHHIATHPTTFVTTNPEMNTVYTTSIAQSHTGQTVLMSDGRIAVMGTDGVQQTIVVHADSSQLSTALAHAQVRRNQNLVGVNVQGELPSVLDDSGVGVVLSGDQTIIQEAGADGSTGLEVMDISLPSEVIDATDMNTLSEEQIVSNSEPPPVESEPLRTEDLTTPVHHEENEDLAVVDKEIIATAEAVPRESTDNGINLMNVSEFDHTPTETETEPTVPKVIVPEEVVCIVCYQAFLNPKCKKKDLEDSEEESQLKLKEKDPLIDKGEQEQNKEIAENICYGQSLGKFFELSRVSMSIVTRRSFKDYEVPICQACQEKLNKAEKLLADLKHIELELFYLRQQIKEEIVNSYNFFKTKENEELADSRKSMPGLIEILEVIDRIREDIINDGRPPKVQRLVKGKPGKKPKKEPATSTEEKAVTTQPNVSNPQIQNEVGATECPVDAEIIAESTEQSSATEIKSTESTETPPKSVKSEKDENNRGRGAIRTSFGRIVKRPSYMISEATEEEISDLSESESSDDNCENINLEPELITGDLNLDDEEDPAWAPERGIFISEKIGLLASSSGESDDDHSDGGSEKESSPKPKIKKIKKAKKFDQEKRIRMQKKKGSKNKLQKRRARSRKVKNAEITKQENVNYEVKVIQLDGTEIMTINTTGPENIGLEPAITQKVMDSQAVIMVKNQLFGKRVQCPHCVRTFTDPVRRDIHVKKKHEGVTKPFECDICHKRFGRQDHLRNHMRRHLRPAKDKISRPKGFSSEKNQCCQYCEQRFRNKSELKIHVRTHTGERPYKCEHCHEAFVSALKREFHIEQAHPEIPPLRCEFCSKGYFRIHRLRNHVISHTGEKTNICEVCGKCFSQAAMLRYHQTTHEELNLKQFKCTDCNRVFANPQNLKSHTESQHQKMYRHRCEACGKGYTQMSHLRRHLRTHSGEQPFECSYCPKKFTSGAALKIHARIHTGERPYWCSQCEKGFRSKTKLGRHLKTLIHTGGDANKSVIKKEEVATEIETVDVNATATASWTEIVGIITGV